MKKVLFVLMVMSLMISCTKSPLPILKATQEKVTYFRVEAEDIDGKVLYSNIVIVKL